jgi:hypothetical protein
VEKVEFVVEERLAKITRLNKREGRGGGRASVPPSSSFTDLATNESYSFLGLSHEHDRQHYVNRIERETRSFLAVHLQRPIDDGFGPLNSAVWQVKLGIKRRQQDWDKKKNPKNLDLVLVPVDPPTKDRPKVELPKKSSSCVVALVSLGKKPIQTPVKLTVKDPWPVLPGKYEDHRFYIRVFDHRGKMTSNLVIRKDGYGNLVFDPGKGKRITVSLSGGPPKKSPALDKIAAILSPPNPARLPGAGQFPPRLPGAKQSPPRAPGQQTARRKSANRQSA